MTDHWEWKRVRGEEVNQFGQTVKPGIMEVQKLHKETGEATYKYYIPRGNAWVETGVQNFNTNEDGKVLELDAQRDQRYSDEKVYN